MAQAWPDLGPITTYIGPESITKNGSSLVQAWDDNLVPGLVPNIGPEYNTKHGPMSHDTSIVTFLKLGSYDKTGLGPTCIYQLLPSFNRILRTYFLAGKIHDFSCHLRR